MPCAPRLLTAVLLLALPWFARAASGDEAAGTEFFERKIRPLLAEHCYKCHGEQEQEGELRLDQLRDLLTPSSDRHVIAPGKPASSLLITAVRYVDADLQMPPDGKLSDEQIADLTRWVEIGAPHPEATAAPQPSAGAAQESAGDHWAFQPLQRPARPRVANSTWVQTPVDEYVLARLESAGLSPAAEAERRDWIRRATFDLTGLPPTPDDVAVFLADHSPEAYLHVVDRLLESPQYGERWGRHWLDVARYADSNGLDENVAHGNAWRYRDWVIAALNDDLPYDQFLQQQIAGDLLPASDPQQRNAHLVATGFLTLGPKVLAEVDETKMEMDIIDEQIDTIGKAVLGLTLGCARCHDHKFDPITSRDYYALAGIFQSTITMESFTKIAKWNENQLHDPEFDRMKTEFDARLACEKQKLDTLLADATAALQAELGQGAALPEKPEESFPQATRDELAKQRASIAEIEKQAPQPPAAMGVHDGEAQNAALHIRGSHLTLGDLVPRGVPRSIGATFAAGKPAIGAQSSGRLELARWLTDPQNPLTVRVVVNRVWRWHFGRGLVETADNFGQLGSEPTHPELLDWLAADFIDSGWSLKKLHRRIMLSATYRMASAADRAVLERDPENRLLSRFPARRLEAEEVRDAMLAVAGQLDMTMGGSMLGTENRKHVFDHTSKDDTTYVAPRRSVYLPVIRNHLHDSFSLFDYADASVPNGNRNTSTVASQALYLMNSDFVQDVASHLAARLRSENATDQRAQVETLYQIALGREVSEAEAAQALEYLQRFHAESASTEDQATDDAAWRMLCQAVLVSNEFFYVR
ncbi:MAG: PSD1 domain-containing protein [Planctomycetales bacterium]|nr:PSD1 domain-containing protein [Planctomycetales bacterium]